MVVQVLFQISERALNLVVRVRHPPTVLSLVCEEVWNVEVQDVHG